MRRALVLTNEAARHPFRASVPACAYARGASIEKQVPWHKRLGLIRSDVEGVAATYCAGFVATLAFFA